jgi:hypothetical protein
MGQQYSGKLYGQDAGKRAKGRPMSDSGTKARFYHSVKDAHMAHVIKVDIEADTYLRTLLIHGARSAILAAQRKARQADRWLTKLPQRRNPNVVAVAMANKNARTILALLAHDREFRPAYMTAKAIM